MAGQSSWRGLRMATCAMPSSILDLRSNLPGRLISRTSPFEGDCDGANPSPAASFISDFRWVSQTCRRWFGSLVPAHSALAGLWLRPDPFRRLPGGSSPVVQKCAVAQSGAISDLRTCIRTELNRTIRAIDSPLAQNQSGSLTNCGRWRVTSTGYQFDLINFAEDCDNRLVSH